MRQQETLSLLDVIAVIARPRPRAVIITLVLLAVHGVLFFLNFECTLIAVNAMNSVNIVKSGNAVRRQSD